MRVFKICRSIAHVVEPKRKEQHSVFNTGQELLCSITLEDINCDTDEAIAIESHVCGLYHFYHKNSIVQWFQTCGSEKRNPANQGVVTNQTKIYLAKPGKFQYPELITLDQLIGRKSTVTSPKGDHWSRQLSIYDHTPITPWP